MAAQGRICAIIHTQYCTYIPVMSTNITHFTKHMNTMIEAMDTPEVSVTSLWETLTSSSWWKTILIIIILICWERAPPMAKVMRKEAWHMQRRDRASGVPLEILEHLPPKPESGRCRVAQLASIRQMSRQVSRGSAADYEADEQAGVSRLSWRLSSR